MLTQVDATNARGSTLGLPVFDYSGGYSVRDIQGLDPVQAAISTSSQAQVDGAQFQNAQRGIRNITMKLGLEPDYLLTTVDSLRARLYDYFMTKSNLSLTFWKDGSVFAVCSGQVETFDCPMFVQDVEADISIICFDPDFYAITPTVISSGTVSDTTVNAIQYDGTSDAGLVFSLAVNRIMSSFTLYNTQPDGTVQTFAVAGSFAPGDVVTINSIPGQKGLFLTRASITTPVLFYADQQNMNWPVLTKGENDFRAYTSGATIPYTVSYTPKYGAL